MANTVEKFTPSGDLVGAVEERLHGNPNFVSASAIASVYGLDVTPELLEQQAARNIAALYERYPDLADQYPPEIVVTGCFNVSSRGYHTEEVYRTAMSRIGKVEGQDYYFLPTHDIITGELLDSVSVFSPTTEGFLLFP